MSKPQKLDWRIVLGAVAVAISASSLGAIAEAAPIKNSFELAQVGVGRRIEAPTAPVPLNLRPRVHIPLPTNGSSRDYYRGGANYNYGRSRHHRRDRHHYPQRHPRRNGGITVIINPATSSSYSSYSEYNGSYGGNYSDSQYSEYQDSGRYIRVIRK